jgi:hypothetical protein
LAEEIRKTLLHELGHCFNLLHSWQKSLAVPPGVNRPNALSWMNYPWRYPGGPTAFWNDFAFQFDDQEIVHIRHGFLNQVIMGGNNFAAGSALTGSGKFDAPVEDHPDPPETRAQDLAPASLSCQSETHATDTRQGRPSPPQSVGRAHQIAIRKPVAA